MTEEVTFDLESITLGELVELEKASQTDFQELLATKAGRLMAARFLLVLRKRGNAPEWSEITNLRLLDVFS